MGRCASKNVGWSSGRELPELPRSGVCLTQVGILALSFDVCVALAKCLNFIETQFHGPLNGDDDGTSVTIQGDWGVKGGPPWVLSECVAQAALVYK